MLRTMHVMAHSSTQIWLCLQGASPPRILTAIDSRHAERCEASHKLLLATVAEYFGECVVLTGKEASLGLDWAEELECIVLKISQKVCSQIEVDNTDTQVVDQSEKKKKKKKKKRAVESQNNDSEAPKVKKVKKK